MKIERRVFPIEDIRTVERDGDEGGMRIEGYAAVFGTPTNIGGMFMETIKRGAFRKTIKEGDPVVLWNHDDSKPLGRLSAGTATFKEDEHGLRNTTDLPDNSWGRDAHVSIDRGDVKGMSFGFSVVKDNWKYQDDESKLTEREITEVRLFEVSPVTFPAYETTEVEARSILDGAPKEPNDDTTPKPGLAAHSEAGPHLDIRKKRLDLLELETRNTETKIP